jgi:hypothetical protein
LQPVIDPLPLALTRIGVEEMALKGEPRQFHCR